MKRTETVTIRNQTYNIKTSVSSEELEEIVAMLNNKLQEIEEQAGTITTHKVAILAALLTTAENYVISKKIDFLIEKISEVCS